MSCGIVVHILGALALWELCVAIICDNQLDHYHRHHSLTQLLLFPHSQLVTTTNSHHHHHCHFQDGTT